MSGQPRVVAIDGEVVSAAADAAEAALAHGAAAAMLPAVHRIAVGHPL